MSRNDGTGPELSVERRILLHLHKYSRAYQDAWEVPNAISQEGISEALDILLNNVSRSMKDLKAGGKVSERLAHIKGGRRKRRAYLLTEEGTRLAEEVLTEVMVLEVPYVGKDGKASSLVVGKVIGQFRLDFGEALAATDVLEAVRRNGTFDAAKFHASMAAAVGGPGEKKTDLADMTDTAPRLARFVGRAGVLAQLEADLEGPGPPIVVVHGMAGIGKTSLALKVLEDLRGRKHLFYYRFHSWDSLGNVAVAFQDLFARMGIRSKAVGSMHEMDLNALALFIVRALEAQPVLLVFDDFHRAGEAIAPLFRVLTDLSRRFSGLRVMLLTRTVPGFYSRKEVSVERVVSEVQLDGLDIDETRALLGEGHGEEAIKRMHSVSRGIPLFLEILVGVDNVDAIGDMRKYMEEEVLSDLRPGERTVLEGLSVHRYPVPPEALLVEGATFDDLNALCRRSIVTELPHRRFEAHDLIKEFVLARLSPDVRAKRHRLAAEYYRSPAVQGPAAEGAQVGTLYLSPELAMLEAVYHMKRSGDVKGAVALLLKVGPELLEQGRTEVRALLESFDRAEVDEEQWSEMLVQQGDAAATVEDWPRALQLYESALEAKRAMGAGKSTLASIHGMIGMAQMHVERWEETERSHGSALGLFEEAGDERGMAKELMHLGMVFRNRKDWTRAMAAYERARKLLEGLDDRPGLVVLHNNVAQLGMAKGDLRAAEKSIRKALEIADGAGYEAGRAVVLFSRGEMERDTGQLEAARRDFDEATEIFRRRKDLGPAIRVQLALGDAFLDAERPKDAQRAYLRALDIYQFKTGSGGSFLSRSRVPEDLGLLGGIYDRLASASRAKGEKKAAMEYDLKALDCYEAKGASAAMARKLLDTGRASEDGRDLRAAKMDFERALDALAETNDKQGKAAVHLNLARVCKAGGDDAAAKGHLEQALALGKGAGDRELVAISEMELRRLSSEKKG
jgi:tetratricopeptide (TPR) repeat protein